MSQKNHSACGTEQVPLFDNQLLNYKQTAQYLSLSEPYLRKLKARGELPFVIVGGRAVRFRVSSLNRWIEEREITNENET